MSVTWPALYLQFMCTTENYPFKKLVDPYVPILNKLQDTLNEKKKKMQRDLCGRKGAGGYNGDYIRHVLVRT